MSEAQDFETGFIFSKVFIGSLMSISNIISMGKIESSYVNTAIDDLASLRFEVFIGDGDGDGDGDGLEAQS